MHAVRGVILQHCRGRKRLFHVRRRAHDGWSRRECHHVLLRVQPGLVFTSRWGAMLALSDGFVQHRDRVLGVHAL